MKKVFRIFLLAVMVSAGFITTNETKAQSANVSFSVFHSSLKSHGRWMNHPTYGQVWISNTKGFVPYSTNGHWAYTDYGWTWVSDYDWGWAPFHYGRWAYHATYGWYWVPGYEWAPAWVAWRNSNDYYGWAPLSPGLSISVGTSGYNSIASGRWVFAPHRYITSPYITRYYVPRRQNVTIIKRTTIVNNVTVKNNVRYVSGPKKEEVEKVNRTKVQTYTVSNSSKPGKTVINNNTVNVYRPVINNDKTVINNKNSNNTTVNKNSNNATVIKNDNDKETTVNKNSDNKTTVNKEVNKTNNETVKKKPTDNKKPLNASQNKPANDNAKQKVKPQQQKKEDDVAKKKKQNNDDNRRK